jgi:CDP-paratose 2-epimerase
MTDPSMADWRPGDQKVFVSDIQKVNQMAGWRPTTSVEEGLDRLSAWVADHEQILKDTLG